MTTDAFHEVMAAVDPPLVVVTTASGQERAGCLVGFHAQSSIDPPRYCIWLSKANHTYRVGLRATHFAVHFLGQHDLGLAEHFGSKTGDDLDKFADLPVELEEGVPVLRAWPNRLLVRKIALLDEGGDHVCITTEPVQSRGGSGFEPLRVSAAKDIEPGHGNEERNAPPTERAAGRRSSGDQSAAHEASVGP